MILPEIRAIDEVMVQLTELGATVEAFADELESLDAGGSGVRTVPGGGRARLLSRVRRRTAELRPLLLATWHPDELVAAVEQVRDAVTTGE